MTANRWESSVVAHLAKEWGIDESTVHKRAAEASRRVRWALGDREQLREQVLSFLNVVAHEARQAGKFGDAAKAAMGVAQIAGLEPRPVPLPAQFRTATELLAWVDANRSRLEAVANEERSTPPQLTEGRDDEDA